MGLFNIDSHVADSLKVHRELLKFHPGMDRMHELRLLKSCAISIKEEVQRYVAYRTCQK